MFLEEQAEEERTGSRDISDVPLEYQDPRILWDGTIKSVVYCD